MQLPGPNNMPGGQLGEAIGNLIQQGLSNSPLPNGTGPGTGRSRGLPGAGTPQGTPATPAPQASPAPTQAQPTQDPPLAQQDSQPMNDVMRQLFNR
jgi:AsmA protein